MPFASANRQSTFLPSWDKAREFHRDVHKFFRMQAQYIFQICTLLFAFVLCWLPSSVFLHQQKSRISPFSISFPEQKEKGSWNPVEGIGSWGHLAQQCRNNPKQKANQQMLLFGILQPLLVLKALLHCAISRATCLAMHCVKSLEIVAESITKFYFLERSLLQILLPRFQPLQVVLQQAMFRATCLATALRQVARKIAQCNSTLNLGQFLLFSHLLWFWVSSQSRYTWRGLPLDLACYITFLLV